MATLSELRTLISNKLADGDLVDPTAAQITAQINSTIAYYQREPFWFNEDIATLTTTADNAVLSGIPSDFGQEITQNALVVKNNGLTYPLTKITPLEYSSIYSDNAKGLPGYYTYRDSQFELFLIPDQAYTIYLYYRKKYTALSADGDSNDFTNNAERLIEYKTLADLLRDYRADEERAAIYDARVEQEYKNIMQQTYDRTTTGLLTTENIVGNDYRPYDYRYNAIYVN